MKLIANRTVVLVRASLVAVALAVSISSASALADDQLPSEPVKERNTHISWHEFRHELSGYSQVMASLSDDGVITLWGHPSDGIQKSRITALARKVEGATEIRNLMITD